jgi:hypothetical protein
VYAQLMSNAQHGPDALNLRAGQRVCRKTTDERGTVTEAEGEINVKWDNGKTSYFRWDKPANVRWDDSKR